MNKMCMNRIFRQMGVALLIAFGGATASMGQGFMEVVRENEAHSFGEAIPVGNYSGIAHVGGDLYALVSDKGERGEVVFVRMAFDAASGDIVSVSHAFTLPTGEGNHDNEDIVYRADSRSFFIAQEEDNVVREFVADTIAANGSLSATGYVLPLPIAQERVYANRGLESLAYDNVTKTFYSVTECPLRGDGELATSDNGALQRLRIMESGADGNVRQYAYRMDNAETSATDKQFVSGVSALASLGGGRLLVLEREAHVPEEYLGAFSVMRLYAVDVSGADDVSSLDALASDAPYVGKHLLYEWRTSLGLLDLGFANYEGMCLGPQLEDGSQVIVLVSDSQNRYMGVLSDWFKTIVVR